MEPAKLGLLDTVEEAPVGCGLLSCRSIKSVVVLVVVVVLSAVVSTVLCTSELGGACVGARGVKESSWSDSSVNGGGCGCCG